MTKSTDPRWLDSEGREVDEEDWHCAPRHPLELRVLHDDGGRRALDHRPHRADAATGDVRRGAAVYLWYCDREGRYSLYSDDAITSGPIVKTSQIALPKEACEAVYASAGYEDSSGRLGRTSLARDTVFGDDGGIHQLATMSGSAAAGHTATLTIAV